MKLVIESDTWQRIMNNWLRLSLAVKINIELIHNK